MNCPYCKEEMKKGYIQSSRQIFWGEEKHKISFVPIGAILGVDIPQWRVQIRKTGGVS